MDQLLSEFLGEADELIERLAGDVQALRAQYQDGRKRREFIARIFRNAHTLKGSSSTLELNAIAELTHEFESLLESVRSGRSTLDESALDLFEETVSSITQMLGAVAVGKQPVVQKTLVERIRKLAKVGGATQPRSHATPRVVSKIPDDIARTLSQQETHQLNETLNEGAGAFVIEINFEMATFDKQFKNLIGTLNKRGEVISTQPGQGASNANQIAFRIVYVTKDSASNLETMLAATEAFELTELVAPNANSKEIQMESESTLHENIAPISTQVRIELSDLEEIIADTKSLFEKTMLALDGAASLAQPTNVVPTGSLIHAEQIRNGFEELKKSLDLLRTVPMAQALTRAVRAGSVAARAAGKKIDFEIEGEDARLDKSVSAAIAGPLLHLLHNAVDHGIESPSERAAQGKSERGIVRLESHVENGQMRLRVIDNGRGIDSQEVTRAAVARGIIQENTEVSREECLRMIFAPGFSTTETISNVSGRGVGLDVVNRAIEQMGGQILVRSEVGVGSTFEMVFPIAKSTLP